MRRAAYTANEPMMRLHGDVSVPDAGRVSSCRPLFVYPVDEIATAESQTGLGAKDAETSLILLHLVAIVC